MEGESHRKDISAALSTFEVGWLAAGRLWRWRADIEWYRARSIWLDFVPKCSDVQDKVDALRQRGGHAQSPGVAAFTRFCAEFCKVFPTVSAYYSSGTQAGAREYRMDKLRSMLDQLLHQLAPRPQVCGSLLAAITAHAPTPIPFPSACVSNRGA